MRYLSLVLAALFFAPNASAQEYATDRGSVLLAGSLHLSNSGDSRDDDRYTLLSVSPSLSYFVTSGLAIGTGLGVSRFSEGGSSSTSLSVGPHIAYYFGGPRSTLFPFLSARVDYADSEGLSGVGVDLAGDTVFMLARNVGLDAEAFYQTYRYSRDNDRGDFTSNTFGLRGGVTVFVF